MGYGCRATCDNCKPVYVWCPECGKKNFLTMTKCTKCKAPLTEESKDAAIAKWHEEASKRTIMGCGFGTPVS